MNFSPSIPISQKRPKVNSKAGSKQFLPMKEANEVLSFGGCRPRHKKASPKKGWLFYGPNYKGQARKSGIITAI
ncbi:MAG TPA: hypothetical protein DCL44_07985 [Elusimicrobia bacterium]|nr:hypothetical protein [Elusimicrobiota bacterium]